MSLRLFSLCVTVQHGHMYRMSDMFQQMIIKTLKWLRFYLQTSFIVNKDNQLI